MLTRDTNRCFIRVAMESFDHFQRALALFGNSDTQLAKAIGCTQNAVWQARRRKSVSPKMALAIERATNREVRKSQLRPDIYPPNEDGQQGLAS